MCPIAARHGHPTPDRPRNANGSFRFDIKRFDAAPISIGAVDRMADKQSTAQDRGRGKNPVRVSCVHNAAGLVRVAANHGFPTQRTVASVQAVDGLAGAKVDTIAGDRGRRGYDPAITQETIGLHLIGARDIGTGSVSRSFGNRLGISISASPRWRRSHRNNRPRIRQRRYRQRPPATR